MSTTTEFYREIAHGYHTYLITVFLTEQCHSTCFLSFFDTHDLCGYRQCSLDLFIYQSLCFCNLFRSHCLEVCEIETQSGRIHQRTFLFYMSAENSLQGFLQQMGCTVVLTGVFSFLLVYFQCYFISVGDHTGFHHTYMTVFATTKFDGIFHTEYTVCSGDHTGVTFLSTHGSVERCLFYKDGSFLTFHQGIHDLCLSGQDSYFGGSFQFVISGKFGCDIAVDLIVYGCISTHIVADCASFSCTFSLNFHLFLEAVFIDGISFFFQDLFGQIHRKSVSIVQTERIRTTQYGFSGFFHLCFQIRKNLQTLVNGLVELTLFVMQNVQDKDFLFFQFRISVFGSFDDGLTQFL